jgi:hypothetical protein
MILEKLNKRIIYIITAILIHTQTASRWFHGATPLTVWHGLTIELKNALTTSSEASLLSKHITYSITAASQGSVILPSSLVNPNSSCNSIRSSQKTTCRGTPAGPRTAARQPSTRRNVLCQPPTSKCCTILRFLSLGSA